MHTVDVASATYTSTRPISDRADVNQGEPSYAHLAFRHHSLSRTRPRVASQMLGGRPRRRPPRRLTRPRRPRPTTPGRAGAGPPRDRRRRRAPGSMRCLRPRASANPTAPPARRRRRGRGRLRRDRPTAGVANSASNSGSSCWRQVREDPAAVVVDHDERRAATPRRAARAGRSCRAGSRGRRTARRRAPACSAPRRRRPSRRSRRCRWRPGSRAPAARRAAPCTTRAPRTGRLDATTSVPPSGTAAATSRAIRPSHATLVVEHRVERAPRPAARRRATPPSHRSRSPARGAEARRPPRASSGVRVGRARARTRRVADRATRRRDRRAPCGIAGRATRSRPCS